MGNYRISEDAQIDLIRIHQRGVRIYGEEKADEYYFNFFEQFEEIAKHPESYQAVNHIRFGYRRSVCGIDNIYYQIEGNTVEIMNIIGRQDADEWL